MKKFFLAAPLFVLCCFVSLEAQNSFALDEHGCLTCHQYPGLVRLEKGDEFKALHIDEEIYSRSPHGKISCIKCHISVEKVPHTGEIRVDCTTNCHFDDKQSPKIKDYPLRRFHQQEQSFITRLEDESSCRVCHPLYPHRENNLVRALLNMHTGFMFCDVCHIKRSKFARITYEWKGTENATFSGAPFGTFYNPHTQHTRKKEHFITRIAAFAIENDNKRDLMNTWDTANAKEFFIKEKGLQPEESAKKIAYFHRDVEKKEISVACDECHSVGGLLNFNALGFDKIKTDHLIKMDIKGLVTKYKIFYFPKLLER